MLRGDHWEAGKGIELHLCVAGVLEFFNRYQSWPALHSLEDAQKLVDIVKERSKQRQDSRDGGCWAQQVSFGFPTGDPRDLDESQIRHYAQLFATELTGLCAFLGGAAAQEILKKTGKFTPISQWIHHDEPALVHIDEDNDTSNVSPLFGSRYDHQIAILGKDFQAKMANQRVFLVGCGALGCEYLKGLSLMGVATGRKGQVIVTDMDRIEGKLLKFSHECSKIVLANPSVSDQSYCSLQFVPSILVSRQGCGIAQERQWGQGSQRMESSNEHYGLGEESWDRQ
jgi:ubiquitin-activating enzyme E1